MSNYFTELEYKYLADNIKLSDFRKLMESYPNEWLNIDDRIFGPTVKEVSSFDIYYTASLEHFIRFRMSKQSPELTIKRKNNETNNWDRVEVDVPLSPEATEETVEKFVNLLDYKKNFKIYKSCFIYFFDNFNTVYYTVYDEEMKEVGRFIEIEINKDKVKMLGDNASIVLKQVENSLEALGITAKNRLKKSLFEMYVK